MRGMMGKPLTDTQSDFRFIALEWGILYAIFQFYSLPLKTIADVYERVKSFDGTIVIIEYAIANAIDPLGVSVEDALK